jgi:hypothetical protein
MPISYIRVMSQIGGIIEFNFRLIIWPLHHHPTSLYSAKISVRKHNWTVLVAVI